MRIKFKKALYTIGIIILKKIFKLYLNLLSLKFNPLLN